MTFIRHHTFRSLIVHPDANPPAYSDDRSKRYQASFDVPGPGNVEIGIRPGHVMSSDSRFIFAPNLEVLEREASAFLRLYDAVGEILGTMKHLDVVQD